jgi:hypothetical protein
VCHGAVNRALSAETNICTLAETMPVEQDADAANTISLSSRYNLVCSSAFRQFCVFAHPSNL